jgi:hypothetical protein
MKRKALALMGGKILLRSRSFNETTKDLEGQQEQAPYSSVYFYSDLIIKKGPTFQLNLLSLFFYYLFFIIFSVFWIGYGA